MRALRLARWARITAVLTLAVLRGAGDFLLLAIAPLRAVDTAMTFASSHRRAPGRLEGVEDAVSRFGLGGSAAGAFVVGLRPGNRLRGPTSLV